MGGLFVYAAQAEPRLTAPVSVFTGGGGYPNFRTPSITAFPDGSLLAVAEGRTFDDPGIGMSDLDIVSRRSTDGGITWGPLQVVDAWAGGANSNPTTVLDSSTGRMFVLFNRWEGFLGTTTSQPGTSNNTAWVRYSDDQGMTWSSAANISSTVKDVNAWNSVAFGPGSGIQASNGRLMIPAARWQNGWASYSVFSADHGQTWSRGQLVPGGNLSNENQLVQLADGRIHMDARPNTGGEGPRSNTRSTNGGVTWASMSAGQISPDSHAAIERLSLASAGADRNRIVFTGPKGSSRTDLVIRTSYDEAISYVNERLLYDGYSGYSDITIMPDGSIGVLFETGEARDLTFVKLNREWLEPPKRLRAFESFRYNSATIPAKNGGLLWNSGWAANPDLTGTSSAKTRLSDLHYTAFPFANEGGRSAFFDNGGSMSRALPVSIDLTSSEPQYFSVLVQQNTLGGSETESSLEALDISLYAGTIKTVSFGVRGNESFYYDLPGAGAQTAADALDKDVAYYLVAKIVPQQSGGDQIFVKSFRSGDPVPSTDDGLGWTLAGAAGAGSSAVLDRIYIKGGSLADWVVDEFRYGDSFGAVVSNVLRFEWTADASGAWGNADNWFDGVPDGAGARTIFGPAISAPRVIDLGPARTVGGMHFDNANSYVLNGAATLSLNGGTTASQINVVSGSHVVAAPIAIVGNLSIQVSSAAAELATSGDLSGTGSISKSGLGRWSAKHIRTGTLSIDAGTVSILNGGGDASTSRITSLAIAAPAALDLNAAAMVVDYSGASPMNQIVTWLVSGRAGGAWNGLGIQSSAVINAGFAVGVVEASEVGTSVFAGQPVDADSILLRFTRAGDANLDQSVDISDFARLAANFNAPAGWSRGDFDYSGNCNIADFAILAANFNQSVPRSTVPEPTTALGGVACLLLGGRSLRRNHRMR